MLTATTMYQTSNVPNVSGAVPEVSLHVGTVQPIYDGKPDISSEVSLHVEHTEGKLDEAKYALLMREVHCAPQVRLSTLQDAVVGGEVFHP